MYVLNSTNFLTILCSVLQWFLISFTALMQLILAIGRHSPYKELFHEIGCNLSWISLEKAVSLAYCSLAILHVNKLGCLWPWVLSCFCEPLLSTAKVIANFVLVTSVFGAWLLTEILAPWYQHLSSIFTIQCYLVIERCDLYCLHSIMECCDLYSAASTGREVCQERSASNIIIVIIIQLQ